MSSKPYFSFRDGNVSVDDIESFDDIKKFLENFKNKYTQTCDNENGSIIVSKESKQNFNFSKNKSKEVEIGNRNYSSLIFSLHCW